MGRKKGSTTKRKCWKIKIIQGEKVILEKEYTTLTEASKDLDMTYCQLFELAPNGRSKKVKKHKFAPEIIVEKISKITTTELILTTPNIEPPTIETINQ